MRSVNNEWVYRWDQPLFLSEDEPAPADADADPDKPGDAVMTVEQFNGAMTAMGKRMLKGVGDAIGAAGFVTKDDLNTALSGITAPTAAPTDPKPVPKPTKPTAAPADAIDAPDDGVPEGMRLKFEQMDTRIKAAEDRADAAEQSLKTEKADGKVDRRNTMITGLFAKADAINPSQCLTIVQDQLIEDDEKGFGVEVKTEFGPDFQPAVDFVPAFLEANKHLRKAKNRQGSGAGDDQGGEGSTDGRYPVSKVADMSLKEYAEKKEQIHREYESGTHATT